MHLQPQLVAAALAALPRAAERDAVYILRCLRSCITGAAKRPGGVAILAESWQLLNEGSLAPLVDTVTAETKCSLHLVLLMAAICQQCLVLLKRANLPAVRLGLCLPLR